MNIAFALPDGLTLGGVTTLSVELSRHLVKVGQAAALIEHSSMYGNPKLDFGLPPEVNMIDCTRLRHPDDPQLELNDYLPAYRSVLPGVIMPNWAYGTFAACAALAAEDADRLRVIGYAHADEAGYYEWLNHYERMIHRFVASTPDIAGKLSQRLPHRRQDILVRPNPVNAPDVLERSYSPVEKPLQLTYVARITQRQKRVYDLVYLAEALAAEKVNFQLRIIGDGVDKDTLCSKLDALEPDLRQRITLETSVPLRQLTEIWRTTDISVLVSEYEGTSLAMLDSMANGCVPVVTRVGGTDIIEQGVNGFCVAVGDMAEMARIIKLLDDNRSNLAVLGRQAHTAIGTKLGYKEYVNWFLEQIAEIWQEPPRPWPAECQLLRLPQAPVQPPPTPPPPQPSPKEIIDNLSGEDIAIHIPIRKLVKAIGFKIARKPAFRWLYRYRSLGKKMMGG